MIERVCGIHALDAEVHDSCPYCTQIRLAARDAEIDRLRAIVDRLPTTADGVPVTPGMQVWDREYGERHYAWHFLRIEHGIGIASKSVGVVILSECYSIREAAQAAGGDT